MGSPQHVQEPFQAAVFSPGGWGFREMLQADIPTRFSKITVAVLITVCLCCSALLTSWVLPPPKSFIQRVLQWTELLDPTNLVISVVSIFLFSEIMNFTFYSEMRSLCVCFKSRQNTRTSTHTLAHFYSFQ